MAAAAGAARTRPSRRSCSAAPSSARRGPMSTSAAGLPAARSAPTTRPAPGSSVSRLTPAGRISPATPRAQAASSGSRRNCRAKVDALGTFAGRLGFALDRVLLYGKGGTAFANDKYELNSIAAYRCQRDPLGLDGRAAASSTPSPTTGPPRSNTITSTSAPARCASRTRPAIFALDTSIRERIHVAKAGINYRFGWAPVGVTY